MQLLDDRVAIVRDDPEKKTPGGIVLPGNAQEKPHTGRVKFVGEGKRNEAGELVPLTVQQGDRVLIGKYSGTDYEREGEELVVLRESDIIAIL